MSDNATSAPRPSKGRAPHRRDESARLAVLHAADDLLAERGFAGVSIEGIAARAGVAKQTIYRWWPSKVDILLDTLIEDSSRELAIPTKGTAQECVTKYLRSLARFLTKDPAGKVLLALLGEAQHDPQVAELFKRRFLDPRRTSELAMLERGADAGELPAGIALDSALDSLLGPIYYRALTGVAIAPAFITALVERTL